MRKQILSLLREINEEIRDDSNNLIAEGVIDSFDIANIVSSLETEFHIEFDPEEIVPENFSFVDRMCELVEKKLSV